MHVANAHAHSPFVALALTIAFAAMPLARTNPIPQYFAPLAAHTLNDPTTTPAHTPRFWNGNADYVESPDEPFRRRADLGSLTALDSDTVLGSLTNLKSTTVLESLTSLSKRTDLVSDTDSQLSASYLAPSTNNTVAKSRSVTTYSRRQPHTKYVPDADSALEGDSLTNPHSVSDVGSPVNRIRREMTSSSPESSTVTIPEDDRSIVGPYSRPAAAL